jgi:ABC-type phosphate transport system substrate-binding protein
MKRGIIILTTIGLLFVVNLLGAQESGSKTFKIIINASNPVISLSKAEISKMFLKKVSKWSSDKPVLPVDLPSNSPVREKFSKSVHGKSAAMIKNYWQQQIYSGRQTPPPEMSNDIKVLAYVQANPGAIGYVSGSFSVEKFKVKELKVK